MEINMYKITESNDYVSLSAFFYENGLEVKPNIKKPERVLKYWECKDSGGKLIAGGALEKRDGKFVVAGIAVDEQYRGHGLGLQLMQIMDNEVQKRGGNEAWLAAKVPDFYKKLGWSSVPGEGAPEISDCLRCPQFGNECTPQIMVKYY